MSRLSHVPNQNKKVDAIQMLVDGVVMRAGDVDNQRAEAGTRLAKPARKLRNVYCAAKQNSKLQKTPTVQSPPPCIRGNLVTKI